MTGRNRILAGIGLAVFAAAFTLLGAVLHREGIIYRARQLAGIELPSDPRAAVGESAATARTKSRERAAAPSDHLALPSYAESAAFWLRKYLEERLPSLADPQVSDWEKVNILREWAYRHVHRAAPQCFLDERYGNRVKREHPALVLQLMYANEGGFSCGGTAFALMNLYKVFGYPAYIYNMGTRRKGLSHVLTLVDIGEEGAPRIVVQDSYFNYTLAENGKPLTFPRLLELLGNRNADRIEIANGTGECKPVVTKKERAAGTAAYLKQHYEVTPVESSGEHVLFCHDFSLDTYEGLAQYADWIEAGIGERNFPYLFLFPLGTEGGPRADALAEQAAGVGLKLAEEHRARSGERAAAP